MDYHLRHKVTALHILAGPHEAKWDLTESFSILLAEDVVNSQRISAQASSEERSVWASLGLATMHDVEEVREIKII